MGIILGIAILVIQLDRYFAANSRLHAEMKVQWVTVFSLKGATYKWWSSRKQDNKILSWETFERAFIEKFIPDVCEMIEAAKEEEQGNKDRDEFHEL